LTLTSSDLVTGVPRPSREFATGTQAPLQRRYYEGNLRLPVKNNAERSGAASERATADIKLPGDGLDGSDEPEAMTLADVRVLFGGREDGANIPVVRVSLDAVSLWWVAGEQEFNVDVGGPCFSASPSRS